VGFDKILFSPSLLPSFNPFLTLLQVFSKLFTEGKLLNTRTQGNARVKKVTRRPWGRQAGKKSKSSRCRGSDSCQHPVNFSQDPGGGDGSLSPSWRAIATAIIFSIGDGCHLGPQLSPFIPNRLIFWGLCKLSREKKKNPSLNTLT